MIKTNTLIIKSPFGKPVFFSICFLLMLTLIGEVVLRALPVRGKIPIALDAKSAYPELETKKRRLDNFSQNHTIDCFIIGSSTADYGFDVQTFQARLQEDNHNYTCFNFGFEGMMMETTAQMLNMLIRLYQPRLIILGTSAVDFDPGCDEVRWLAKTPWLEYKLGNFSPQGWLADKSFIYQSLLAIPRWRQERYWRELEQTQNEIDAVGWRQKQALYDIDTWLEKIKVNQPLRLKNYHMNPADIEGLKLILSTQQQNDLKIIVVEMPIYTPYMPMYVEGGESVYQKEFKTPLAEIVASYKTPLIDGRELESTIEKKDWKDGFHLGPTGARLFSDWAAAQIAPLLSTSTP